VIYLDEPWAPALLNYVCYRCFAPLQLQGDHPVCPQHGSTMWLHRDRRSYVKRLRGILEAKSLMWLGIPRAA